MTTRSEAAGIRSKGDPRARGREGDRRLIRQYRAGDTRARDIMIERHLPLARSLATRYRHGLVPLEDLFQVAAVGLVKAVDRWDPDRGVEFATFAVPTIAGELRRHFRDTTWAVRPPRSLQELAALVERARNALQAETGREPAIGDLAARLGRPPQDIRAALLAREARTPASLEAPIAEGDELRATPGCEDAGYQRAETRATIARLVSVLDEPEQALLRLRFEQDLTQSEIARRLTCSQMQVSRALRAVLAKLAQHARIAGGPRPLAAA